MVITLSIYFCAVCELQSILLKPITFYTAHSLIKYQYREEN